MLLKNLFPFETKRKIKAPITYPQLQNTLKYNRRNKNILRLPQKDNLRTYEGFAEKDKIYFEREANFKLTNFGGTQ